MGDGIGFPLSYDSEWTMSTGPLTSVVYTDSTGSTKTAVPEHCMMCNDKDRLCVSDVLNTLAKLKARLMQAPRIGCYHCITCKMTPQVKDNIILASKKAKMYGKDVMKTIPCFDEFGNKIKNKLETSDFFSGVDLKIVEPEVYGEYYLEFQGEDDSEYLPF